MNQTFKLKNGQISFDSDKIVISDNAKRLKYITQACHFFTIICIAFTLFNFERSGESSYSLAMLIMIILISITNIITNYLFSTQSTVLVGDIKSIDIKKRFNNTMLDIQLRNNRHRRVMEIQEIPELNNYVKTHFKVN